MKKISGDNGNKLTEKETLKILTIGKLIMIRNVHIHLCTFISPN